MPKYNDPVTGQGQALRRRRIPASLLGFAGILVIAFCGGTAWLGVRAHRLHVAEEALGRFGATIGISPRCPDWLRSLIGDDWRYILDRIDMVNLEGSPLSPDDLVHLQGLPHLRWLSLRDAPFITDRAAVYLVQLGNLKKLDLGNTQVTEAALAQLSRLKNLEELQLDGTQITDAGMESAARLTNLEGLHLSNTRISDAGLASLKSLKKLKALFLDGTQVTDAGLANLAGMTSLQYVALDETGITDDGIVWLGQLPDLSGLGLADSQVTGASLRELPTLKWLDLGGAPITDEGAKNLGTLTGLEELFLHNTRIGDGTLGALTGLTHMTRLDLDGTLVTDAGVTELKRALPRLKVNK